MQIPNSFFDAGGSMAISQIVLLIVVLFSITSV